MLRKGLTMCALAVALLAAFAAPAQAATVVTAVGTVTANQTSCDDLGARVSLSVSAGFANTQYTATAVGSTLSPTKTFTTNGSGSGSTVMTNVRATNGQMTGTAQINLAAAGQTGSITFPVACQGGKGG